MGPNRFQTYLKSYPLEKEERVKMQSMKNNYKSCSEIEAEMKNVVIENFLDFDVKVRVCML